MRHQIEAALHHVVQMAREQLSAAEGDLKQARGAPTAEGIDGAMEFARSIDAAEWRARLAAERFEATVDTASMIRSWLGIEGGDVREAQAEDAPVGRPIAELKAQARRSAYMAEAPSADYRRGD